MNLADLWFVLIAVLWAAWIATDGFDLGCGILYPFIGKSPDEKALIVNSIAPVWDGNEVWLITAAGATFAAFPAVYAGLFSLLYVPFALLLFSLILRGTALEFIYKGEGIAWVRTWGMVFFAGSIIAPFMFGFIFGNIAQGIGFSSDGFSAGACSLINPFSIFTGTFFAILCMLHGGLWISMKSAGEMKARAKRTAVTSWNVLCVLSVVMVIEVLLFTTLYKNYLRIPLLFILPLLASCSFVGIRVFISNSRPGLSFALSIAFIFMLFLCIFSGLYPALLISSIDAEASLTVSNSSSSSYTLGLMTIVAAVTVPVIIASQSFVYRVFRSSGNK